MDKIELGMSTEAIAELIDLSIPPKRQEEQGITITELVRQSKIVKGTALKILNKRDDLTPVKMRNYNGLYTTVYLANEEAQKYQNWIVKEF